MIFFVDGGSNHTNQEVLKKIISGSNQQLEKWNQSLMIKQKPLLWIVFEHLIIQFLLISFGCLKNIIQYLGGGIVAESVIMWFESPFYVKQINCVNFLKVRNELACAQSLQWPREQPFGKV